MCMLRDLSFVVYHLTLSNHIILIYLDRSKLYINIYATTT